MLRGRVGVCLGGYIWRGAVWYKIVLPGKHLQGKMLQESSLAWQFLSPGMNCRIRCLLYRVSETCGSVEVCCPAKLSKFKKTSQGDIFVLTHFALLPWKKRSTGWKLHMFSDSILIHREHLPVSKWGVCILKLSGAFIGRAGVMSSTL